jgi:hypothetical protein
VLHKTIRDQQWLQIQLSLASYEKLCLQVACTAARVICAGRKAELQETLTAARQEQGPLSQLQHQPKQQNWSDLTSEQIRSQLQLRELETGGLKPALVERITEAAGPEVVLVNPSDPDAVAAAKAAAKAAALQDQSGYAESQPIESASTDATDLSSYK